VKILKESFAHVSEQWCQTHEDHSASTVATISKVNPLPLPLPLSPPIRRFLPRHPVTPSPRHPVTPSPRHPVMPGHVSHSQGRGVTRSASL
jgi:hypothetical protein